MKIFVVHGTYAAGPSEGDGWWQNNGKFVKAVNRYSGVTGAPVKVIQFHWDGENKETSRRSFGKELFHEFVKHESTGGQEYVVVGHSHGGSVIKEALLYASKQKQPLAKLTMWVTVGTPFVHFSNRINVFRKSNYYQKLGLIATFMTGVIISILSLSFGGFQEDILFWEFVYMLRFFEPFAAILLLLVVYFRLRDWRYKKRIKIYFSSYFIRRWKPYNHPLDEAVISLSNISKLQVELLGGNYLDRIFIVFSLTFPLLIFGSIYVFSEGFYSLLEGEVDRNFQEFGSFDKFLTTIQMLFYPYFAKLTPFETGIGALDGFLSVIRFSVFYSIFCLLASLIIIIFGKVVGFMSTGLVNNILQNQIVLNALGVDIATEQVTGAGQHPFASEAINDTLPIAIADQIAEQSNFCLSTKAPEVRKLAVDGAKYSNDWLKILENYELSNELIHNTYFNVASFRKLLIYKIWEASKVSKIPIDATD